MRLILPFPEILQLTAASTLMEKDMPRSQDQEQGQPPAIGVQAPVMVETETARLALKEVPHTVRQPNQLILDRAGEAPKVALVAEP